MLYNNQEGFFMANLTREEAWELVKEYNKDPFHLRHALTVEGVMRWYANELGYGDEADFWALAGLLHDLDFEMYPEHHCIKSQEIMRERGIDEKLIHATASHGYGLVCDVKPEHQMEKVLFAADELTGLIGAAALMRPSKSVSDMEVKSIKKKFKDKKFAAGCHREVIAQGAEMLGWTLDELFEKTIEAMRVDEAKINEICPTVLPRQCCFCSRVTKLLALRRVCLTAATSACRMRRLILSATLKTHRP